MTVPGPRLCSRPSSLLFIYIFPPYYSYRSTFWAFFFFFIVCLWWIESEQLWWPLNKRVRKEKNRSREEGDILKEIRGERKKILDGSVGRRITFIGPQCFLLFDTAPPISDWQTTFRRKGEREKRKNDWIILLCICRFCFPYSLLFPSCCSIIISGQKMSLFDSFVFITLAWIGPLFSKWIWGNFRGLVFFFIPQKSMYPPPPPHMWWGGKKWRKEKKGRRIPVDQFGAVKLNRMRDDMRIRRAGQEPVGW